MAVGEASKGARLVAATALAVTVVLGYYFWTETLISRDLFERLENTSVHLVNANRTVREQNIALEAIKEQVKKLEEEKKKLDEEKKKVDEEKKKVDEEKKKLTDEKTALETKLKEATDNVQKVTADKKTADDLCTRTCDDRVAKAVEECRKKQGK